MILGKQRWPIAVLGLALAFALPAQAQFSPSTRARLNLGVQVGGVYPNTELDSKLGLQASGVLRMGLTPRVLVEVNGTYARFTTTDVLYNIYSNELPFGDYDLTRERDYTTLLNQYGARLLYCPWIGRKWSSFVYAGAGVMNYKYDKPTPRRGVNKTKDWASYVPVGLGTQRRITERVSIEATAGYTYIFSDLINEVDKGFARAGEQIGDKAKDGYFGATIGITVRPFGKKKPSRVVAAPVAAPAPVAVPEPPKVVVPPAKPAPAPAPAPVEVKRELPPAYEPPETFATIFYAFDSSELGPKDRETMDSVIVILKAHPDLQVEVRGYADSTGTAEYNQRLSLRRAEAAQAYLVAHGVSASRLTVKVYGESHAVWPNKTLLGRQQNRRVEIAHSKR